jgi:hypothetical protein
LRLLGVTATNLQPAGDAQGSLFPDGAAVRDRTLDRVVDAVADRVGVWKSG